MEVLASFKSLFLMTGIHSGIHTQARLAFRRNVCLIV